MNGQTISPRDLLSLLQSDAKVDLIDVRSGIEYRGVHAAGAKLIPLDQLDPAAVAAGRDRSPLYLICKSGQRAAKAAQKFRDAGFDNAVVVEGGTDAWLAAGCPVERGRAVMSLKRQVRIAAGSLVLAGTILAATVLGWFLIVPAFVGSGLVFAGLSDWCGMGLLLARAPWNRVDSAADLKGRVTCQAN